VRDGRFRGDLYHRLAQFKLDVPPLRDRPDDIIGLAEQALHEHYPRSRFSRDAVAALLGYSWPGNVRELRNMIFRAVMQAKDASAEMTALDLQLPSLVPRLEPEDFPSGDLSQVERRMIFQALEKSRGNQGQAAQILGISRRTLIRKLKLYRTSGAEAPAATLGPMQQLYYRARMELPVKMKLSNEHFPGLLLNLSLGGAGIKTERMLPYGAYVTLVFLIPGEQGETEMVGRVAWTNKDGQHGIQFSELSAPLRTALQRWLWAEMQKDGWDLAGTE